MKLKIIVLVVVEIFYSISIFSQCSDAGVCSIGKYSLNPDEDSPGSIGLSYTFGISGEEPDITGELNDLTFNTVTLEANQRLTNNTAVSLSIPYVSISGPLGDNNGIGDLIILFNSDFAIDENQSISPTLGGKFPTGKGNSDEQLPQRYQPGLGTYDLLLGIVYTYKNFNVGVAYQKPFGRSDNSLDRGGDLLLRGGYNQTFGSLDIKGEILAIIKLQEANILTPIPEFPSTEIPGSDEAQVNLLVTAGYNLGSNINLQVQAAIPFLKKDYNYDGLKRAFTIGTGLSYNL